jgi:hypothetical protein
MRTLVHELAHPRVGRNGRRQADVLVDFGTFCAGLVRR